MYARIVHYILRNSHNIMKHYVMHVDRRVHHRIHKHRRGMHTAIAAALGRCLSAHYLYLHNQLFNELINYPSVLYLRV